MYVPFSKKQAKARMWSEKKRAREENIKEKKKKKKISEYLLSSGVIDVLNV